MKRKYIVKTMFIILFALLTIGCSDTDSHIDKEIEDQKGTPRLEFSMALSSMNMPYLEKHPDLHHDKYLKELERLTNTSIDLEIIPHQEMIEKTSLMMATDNIPDVLHANSLYGPELAGGVETGDFLPLNHLLEEYGQDLLEFIPEEAWETVTHSDGNIYGIPDFLSNTSRRGTAIRIDLLEKSGLDIPETTDEFLEVLRAFKDLGVAQPFQGREEFKYADVFFGAFDALPYQWELYEDEVVPKFMAGDKIKDALQFYRTMYEEELIHPDFLTISQPEFRQNIITGNAGIWSMNANALNTYQHEINEYIPDAEIAIIPSPLGPDGKGGHYYYNHAIRIYLIHKNSQVPPESIIQFFNCMVSEEAETFFTYGIEDDTYTINAQGEIDYKMDKSVEAFDEQNFRNNWLWLVKDSTYTEGILTITDEGKEIINIIDNILANEGRSSIQFEPALEALINNPDIQPGSDTPSRYWMTEAVKIILGIEPLDYHDEIIDIWLNKGGYEAIEEATKRYDDDDFHETGVAE